MKDRVMEFLARHFGAEGIEETDEFAEELSCDSIDMVELTMAVEDEFNIVITDEESEAVSTVADLIRLVTKKFL